MAAPMTIVVSIARKMRDGSWSQAAHAASAETTDPIGAANARLDEEPDRFGDGRSCGDELATIILDAERARRRAADEHARLPRRP